MLLALLIGWFSLLTTAALAESFQTALLNFNRTLAALVQVERQSVLLTSRHEKQLLTQVKQHLETELAAQREALFTVLQAQQNVLGSHMATAPERILPITHPTRGIAHVFTDHARVVGVPTAPVLALRSGTIAYSGPFRDYGWLVILTHGTEHDVYAGLAPNALPVGTHVTAQAALGTLPNTPKPELFLEVRTPTGMRPPTFGESGNTLN